MNMLTEKQIAAFAAYLKREELSAGTVDKYLRDVRQIASCKDVAWLADVLGHSSIETTRIYPT